MVKKNFELDASQKEALERRLEKHHSDFSSITLPSMPNVPGMISEAEKRYLYWLTSQCVLTSLGVSFLYRMN